MRIKRALIRNITAIARHSIWQAYAWSRDLMVSNYRGEQGLFWWRHSYPGSRSRSSSESSFESDTGELEPEEEFLCPECGALPSCPECGARVHPTRRKGMNDANQTSTD